METSESMLSETPMSSLPTEIDNRLKQLAQSGIDSEKAGRADESVLMWQEAIAITPEPKDAYPETIWFLSAIGDVYFRRARFREAREFFRRAYEGMHAQGYADNFIVMRLGECCYECGNKEKAAQHLRDASNMEEDIVFDSAALNDAKARRYCAIMKEFPHDIVPMFM